MFGWIYRRMASGFYEALMDHLASPEVQEELTSMVDGAVDRQMQRFYGKFGGAMKGVNAEIDRQMPPIFKRDGSLNLKGLLGAFLQGGGLQGFMQGQQALPSNTTAGSSELPRSLTL